MDKFAVIDTETNWADRVMSIGVVIADGAAFAPLESKYYILPTEYQIGGMYEGTVFLETPVKPILCTRREAIADMKRWFKTNGVENLFAYNASFDRNHLKELSRFQWFDIMRLAAYRQHNPFIPAGADCFSTGRLKRGYSVEAMLQLLTGQRSYTETHNAYHDALDELKIMQLLRHPLSAYPPLR